MANNTRFLILPGLHGGNLASRVLSLRRLSADFEAARPSGAGCGDLRGPVAVRRHVLPGVQLDGARRDARLRPRGRRLDRAREPKRVFVRALRAARAALSGLDEPVSRCAGRGCPEPPVEDRLRSLYDFLREVPEYRKARGTRHRLATVLAVAVAARLDTGRGRHGAARGGLEPVEPGERGRYQRLITPHRRLGATLETGETLWYARAPYQTTVAGLSEIRFEVPFTPFSNAIVRRHEPPTQFSSSTPHVAPTAPASAASVPSPLRSRSPRKV